MANQDPVTESDRNWLLRRVDWRYLLNDPQPKISVCFGDGRLAQAISLISDQVVDAGSVPHASCDLAAAINPDAKTLHAAWTALKPGGALYTEWLLPTANRARHRLRSAGFQDVQGYWSWPPADRSPLFWVPLGTRSVQNAWRYVIGSRSPDRQRWRQWTRWLMRSAAYLTQRLGVLAPVHALAYKSDPAKDSTSTTTLNDWLRVHWPEWPLDPLTGELSLLFLTGGLRSSNKIAVLVFDEHEAWPRLIVKLPRVAESIAALQREAETLKAVQTRRKTPMPGVPQLIFCEHDRLGETVISGVPVFTQLNHANYRGWALKATDWLIELAGEPQTVARDAWRRSIESELVNFVNSFGAILDQRELEVTRRILEQIAALPSVCEHRDFSPWNVLIASDGELGILDWESAELDGLPLLDLIYCLTYLAFFVEGAMETKRFVEAYQTAWNAQTSIGQVNADCVRQYCAALQLDETIAPALRLFTWLLHSRSEYARLRADSGGWPTDQQLRDSVCVRLWRAELSRTEPPRA